MNTCQDYRVYSVFILDSRFVKPPHVVQDVELLPPLGEVNVAIREGVRVTNMDEGQVLQHYTATQTHGQTA